MSLYCSLIILNRLDSLKQLQDYYRFLMPSTSLLNFTLHLFVACDTIILKLIIFKSVQYQYSLYSIRYTILLFNLFVLKKTLIKLHN